jgi:RimJ/RimL family protein N-acetyltransferase
VTERFRPQHDQRPDDAPWPEAVWPPADDALLRGGVVELRPTVLDDAPELLHAFIDDRVWTHLASRRPGDVEAMERMAASMVASGWVPWTVRLLADVGNCAAGQVVGWSSYLEVSAKDARLEVGGTAYDPAVWGTSVNSSCKLLLLEHAFEVLHMGRVQLKTDVRNERSQRAISAIGATYEGVLRRYQRRADHTVRDTVVFSVTAEEWPTVKDHLLARIAARG